MHDTKALEKQNGTRKESCSRNSLVNKHLDADATAAIPLSNRIFPSLLWCDFKLNALGSKEHCN